MEASAPRACARQKEGPPQGEALSLQSERIPQILQLERAQV